MMGNVESGLLGRDLVHWNWQLFVALQWAVHWGVWYGLVGDGVALAVQNMVIRHPVSSHRDPLSVHT